MILTRPNYDLGQWRIKVEVMVIMSCHVMSCHVMSCHHVSLWRCPDWLPGPGLRLRAAAAGGGRRDQAEPQNMQRSQVRRGGRKPFINQPLAFTGLMTTDSSTLMNIWWGKLTFNITQTIQILRKCILSKWSFSNFTILYPNWVCVCSIRLRTGSCSQAGGCRGQGVRLKLSAEVTLCWGLYNN